VTIRIPVELVGDTGIDASLDRAASRAGQSAGRAFSRAFERQTDDLEIDASSLGGSGGFEAAGSEGGSGMLGGLSGTLKSAGPAAIATAVVGLGLIAGKVLGDALGEALNLQAATGKIAASLGGTVEDAERFGRIASNLYADAWGESLGEVTDAVGAVQASFKGLSDEGLQDATQDALAFSTIFDVDIPTAVNIAKLAVNQGLARDSSQAFDLMTTAAQKVPVALRENVLEAVEEYGGFFTQIGIEGPAAFGLLAAGATQGQFGIDKVGDAIKEFTIRATDGSAASVAAFETIKLNAEDMSNAIVSGGAEAGDATRKIAAGLLKIQDPSKRAQTAIALFGTPLEDIGTKNIPAFLTSLARGGRAMGDFEGATDRASNTLNDNAATAWTEFKRTVEISFVEFMGKEVVPLLTDVAQDIIKFADAFRNLGKGGTGMPEASQEVKDTWAEIQESFEVFSELALQIWDRWGEDIKKFIQEDLRSTLKIVRGVFQILTGIFKVVSGILSGDWKKTWSGIKDIASGAVKVVLGIIQKGAARWRLVFTVLGDVIKQAVRNMWEAAKNLTRDGINAQVDFIRSLPRRIAGVASLFLSAGRKLGESVIEGIQRGISATGGLLSDIGSQIRSAINDALNLPITLGKGPLKFTIPAFADGVQNFRGGLALVGEEGPEIVELPKGSNVIPNGQSVGVSKRIEPNTEGGATINQNFFGPTTSGGRLQELQWTLKYATSARRELFEGVAV